MRRYRLHIPDGELEWMERSYERMAGSGWMLAKRGLFFDRFDGKEPQKLVFRIETRPRGEEQARRQREEYGEAGWQMAAGDGEFCVYTRQGEKRDCAEMEEWRAQTWKRLKRRSLGKLLGLFLVVALSLLMYGISAGSPETLGASLLLGLVKRFWGMVCLMLIVLLELWACAQQIAGVYRAARRFKDGEEDTAPGRSAVCIGIYRGTNLAAAVLFAALLAGISLAPESLPETADGPYLLAGELGISGTRTEGPARKAESGRTYHKSPWASGWETKEYVQTPEGEKIAIFQEIYECRNPKLAERLLPLLMNTDPFGGGFRKEAAGEMDALYRGTASLIAVKGKYVGSLQLFGTSPGQEEEAIEILAEKWGGD